MAGLSGILSTHAHVVQNTHTHTHTHTHKGGQRNDHRDIDARVSSGGQEEDASQLAKLAGLLSLERARARARERERERERERGRKR
jgi:hypothetical protein